VVDKRVVAAAPTPRGIVVATRDPVGDVAAVGLVTPGATSVELYEVPCTPAAVAADGRGATLFCEDPLAVVTLSEEARPARMERLRKVVADSHRVDGYVEGALDRSGKPEDQRLYESPRVWAQVDRHNVPLMRQGHFAWAGLADGHVLATLDFPGGGSPTVAPHAPYGVTLEYGPGRLAPLGLWRHASWCNMTDAALIVEPGSVAGHWLGMEQSSPFAVFELAGAGDTVTARRPLDESVARCTARSGELVCIDAEGQVFALAHSGARRTLAAIAKKPGETTAGFCGDGATLHVLLRREASGLTTFRLFDVAGRSARLIREESVDGAGLVCGPEGSLAFLSSQASASLLPLGARPR
jgi:hypothetical protein